MRWPPTAALSSVENILIVSTWQRFTTHRSCFSFSSASVRRLTAGSPRSSRTNRAAQPLPHHRRQPSSDKARPGIETGAGDQEAFAVGRGEVLGYEALHAIVEVREAVLPVRSSGHVRGSGSSKSETWRSRKPPRFKVRPYLRQTGPESSRRHHDFPPWP